MSANYVLLSRYTYITVLVTYASLLVLYVLTLLMYPSCGRSANLFIAGLHIVPLLFFLPSLMRHHVRAYVWLCFILCGYFLAAVPNALGCSTVLNVTEPILVVVLFISAMMYVRWRSRVMAARQSLN
ncbi:MAG: putative membrane protein [Pseudohongiellaceae bacterium]|jgi:uncharacterized membrane protein